MISGDRWADLGPRFFSAIALVFLAAICLFLGGFIFNLFVAVAVGLMAWELLRMTPDMPAQSIIKVAALAGVLMFISAWLPQWGAIMIGIIALATLAIIHQGFRGAWFAYGCGIVAAAIGLIYMRKFGGAVEVLWVIVVVVATDVAGYFVGKILGGPKFWPALSPKKTWSGIIGGWAAAVLVAMIFCAVFGMARSTIFLAVVVSFASQLGDIFESALKRRAGIKDSSNLIPGHGGVLDRFDGIIGAMLAVLMFTGLTGVAL